MSKSSRLNNDKVVRTHFRVLGSTTSSSSASTFVINSLELTLANLGSRAAAMATSFEYWRIKSLRLTGYTNQCGLTYDTSGTTKVGNVNAYYGIAYDPDPVALATAPTQSDAFLQFMHSTVGNCRHRLSLSISGQDTIGARPFKWLSTTSTGTPPTGESSAGGLWILTRNETSTGSPWIAYCIVEGVLEFKTQVAPSVARLMAVAATIEEQDEEFVMARNDESKEDSRSVRSVAQPRHDRKGPR